MFSYIFIVYNGTATILFCMFYSLFLVIKDKIGDAYSSAVLSYNATDSRSAAVDTLQRKLHCCGKNNFTDWSETSYFRENGIPASCCKSDNCSPESLKDLDKAKTEVIGIFLACCLSRYITNNQYEMV
uniref:Tetraspanin 6 n=1 Tax=Fundulus heteroclitus TaxID=8078 RepID=A0A3Q2QTS3_FUNHE